MITPLLRKFGYFYTEIEKLYSDKEYEIFSVYDKSSKIYLLKLFKKDYAPEKFFNEVKIYSLLCKTDNPFFFKYKSNSNDEMIVKEKYIVFELAKMDSLINFISEGNFLTEQSAKIVAWKLFHSVKYMHQKGIAHRCISAKNIYLDRYFNCKIGKLDSALMLENADKDAIQNYFRKDIIKLGLLLIQLLTGKYILENNKDLIRLIKGKKSDNTKTKCELFWKIIYMNGVFDFSKDLKNLVEIMIFGKISDIQVILNHSWFSGIENEFEKAGKGTKDGFKKKEGANTP